MQYDCNKHCEGNRTCHTTNRLCGCGKHNVYTNQTECAWCLSNHVKRKETIPCVGYVAGGGICGETSIKGCAFCETCNKSLPWRFCSVHKKHHDEEAVSSGAIQGSFNEQGQFICAKRSNPLDNVRRQISRFLTATAESLKELARSETMVAGAAQILGDVRKHLETARRNSVVGDKPEVLAESVRKLTEVESVVNELLRTLRCHGMDPADSVSQAAEDVKTIIQPRSPRNPRRNAKRKRVIAAEPVQGPPHNTRFKRTAEAHMLHDTVQEIMQTGVSVDTTTGTCGDTEMLPVAVDELLLPAEKGNDMDLNGILDAAFSEVPHHMTGFDLNLSW